MSSQGTPIVGIVVAILIIGAVASIGYYQFEVAPAGGTTSTTATTSSAPCTPSTCVHIMMVAGASSQPSNYTGGSSVFLQYGYSPDVVTVVIGQNNTVYWTNNDTAIHTATDAGVFTSGCVGDSCPSGANPSFQYTFTTPGTYRYACDYHPWMQGEIIVKSG